MPYQSVPRRTAGGRTRPIDRSKWSNRLEHPVPLAYAKALERFDSASSDDGILTSSETNLELSQSNPPVTSSPIQIPLVRDDGSVGWVNNGRVGEVLDVSVSLTDTIMIEDIVSLQKQIDVLRREASEKAPTKLQTVWEEQFGGSGKTNEKSLELDQSPLAPLSGEPGGTWPYYSTRPHFRIDRSNYSSDSDEDEHSWSDEETLLELVKEALRCCRRRKRRMRALVDLVGIEPNPGPKGGKTKMVMPSSAIKRKVKKEVRKEEMKITAPRVPRGVNASKGRYLTGEVFNPRADMSAYMRTLCDAERYPPVRLGGETMIQTALTQLHGSYTVTIVDPTFQFVVHPRLWLPLLFSGDTGPGLYNYGAVNMFPAAAITQLQSLGSGARVVSAKLKIFTTAAANNDGGALCVGLSPRDDGFMGGLESGQKVTTNPGYCNSVSSGGFPIITNSGSSNPNQFSATQGNREFQSYDWTDIVPLKQGASVFWLPEDPQTMTFITDRLRQSTIQSEQVVSGTSSFVNVYNSTVIEDPFFVASITGAASGTVVQFELFLNLEYTVTSGAAGIIDTTAGAMNSLQAFEVVKKVGGNLQNTVEPNPEASLGDKLLTVAGNVVRGGLGQVSKFLFGSSDLGTSAYDLIAGR